MEYSTDSDPDKTAKAYGYELYCSVKDSKNIARALRGKPLGYAKKYVQEVIDGGRAVPAVYHKRKRSHRKKMGPGSFPKKAAKEIMKIIINAENNAEYKGFDSENMKIKHISAYGGRVIKGIMPRAFGRATSKSRRTTNIEIILEEVE